MKTYTIRYYKGTDFHKEFTATFEHIDEAVLFYETLLYLRGYHVIDHRPVA